MAGDEPVKFKLHQPHLHGARLATCFTNQVIDGDGCRPNQIENALAQIGWRGRPFALFRQPGWRPAFPGHWRFGNIIQRQFIPKLVLPLCCAGIARQWRPQIKLWLKRLKDMRRLAAQRCPAPDQIIGAACARIERRARHSKHLAPLFGGELRSDERA